MSADGWLDQLDAALVEAGGDSEADAYIALALAAGRDIEVPEDELRGAVKRSLFVLAAGGDPNRGLDLDGRAVETIAEDLDSPFRRKILDTGLKDLQREAGERSAVSRVLAALQADGELAWRAFASARMVELLSAEELNG